MIEAAALVASVGLLLLGAASLLVAAGLYWRLVAMVPGAPQLPFVGGRSTEVPEPPAALDEWINAESEPWARQELRGLMEKLWREHEDWVVVEREMRRTLADQPSPEESLHAF